MKKLKDFFYNKNDIIIVLIILAIAALIIYTRIGAIMDYPATVSYTHLDVYKRQISFLSGAPLLAEYDVLLSTSTCPFSIAGDIAFPSFTSGATRINITIASTNATAYGDFRLLP